MTSAAAAPLAVCKASRFAAASRILIISVELLLVNLDKFGRIEKDCCPGLVAFKRAEGRASELG